MDSQVVVDSLQEVAVDSQAAVDSQVAVDSQAAVDNQVAVDSRQDVVAVDIPFVEDML